MNIEVSKDGTVRFDFAGYSAVLIRIGGRNTLCLSSQVGCAMGCRFCQSGKDGFKRDLSLDELKEQLEVAWDYAKFGGCNSVVGGRRLADDISGIVFMGMGEPMNNLDNVLAFCDWVNSEFGFAYSRILISTSGVLPGMERVLRDYSNRLQLAVSLHSAFQDVRDRLMPGVRGFGLDKLVDFCHRYNKVYRQKIMIEYVMINGVTDRDQDLEALKNLGLEKRTLFNLIPLNSEFELEGEVMRASGKDVIEKFRRGLMDAGYKCFTRVRFGADIDAACGMLR